MIRVTVALLVAITLAGCGGSDPGSFERTTSVTEQQAIDAARDAVKQNDSFSNSVTFVAAAKGNGWQVDVRDETSGEERVVIIGPEGNVVMYRGGGGGDD